MRKSTTLISLSATALVAALIGCSGGGGGGGVTGITGSTNASAGGNAGGNAGSTNAGTTGTPGTLPSNVVFYGEDAGQGNTSLVQIRHINPDRSADTLYASLPEAFRGFGLNPSVAGQVLFGYDPNGSGVFGLFRNSSVSAEGALTIVPPSYSEIDSISVTPDGTNVIFVATPSNGTSGLFRVPIGGGTPERLDDAEDAALSPSGFLVAYTKLPGGAETADVFIRDLRQATSTVPRNLTGTPVEEAYPSWSRSGNRVVFSRQVSDANFDLFAVDASNGANPVQITNTENQIEYGPSFSGDDTQVAFTLLSGIDPGQNGLFRQEAKANSDTSRFQIKSSPAILASTHWTNFVGRAQNRAVSNLLMRLKKRKATDGK